MFALGQKQTCAAHKPNIFDLTQGRNDENRDKLFFAECKVGGATPSHGPHSVGPGQGLWCWSPRFCPGPLKMNAEEKMKMLPQVLFWLGLVSVPFAWLVWYFGPQLEMIRPVFANISDPALRAALQEAHAERLGLWVAVWPVSFLVMSQILEKKMQG